MMRIRLIAPIAALASLIASCGEDQAEVAATTDQSACWQSEDVTYELLDPDQLGATEGDAIAKRDAYNKRKLKEYESRGGGFYEGYDADVYRAKVDKYAKLKLKKRAKISDGEVAVYTVEGTAAPTAEVVVEKHPSKSWGVVQESWQVPNEVCERLRQRDPISTTTSLLEELPIDVGPLPDAETSLPVEGGSGTETDTSLP